MKKKFSTIINIGLWAIIIYLFAQRCVFNSAPEAITISQFVVEDLEGNTVDWADFKDKPVFINFWASWCPPCRAEMPSIRSLYKQYGADMQFIIANTENKQDVVRYLNSQEPSDIALPFYILRQVDGVDLSSIPLTIIFDHNGQAQIAHEGFNLWNSPLAKSQVKKLIKQSQ